MGARDNAHEDPGPAFSVRARDPAREAELKAALLDITRGGPKARAARVKLHAFPMVLTIQYKDAVDTFQVLGWDL